MNCNTAKKQNTLNIRTKLKVGKTLPFGNMASANRLAPTGDLHFWDKHDKSNVHIHCVLSSHFQQCDKLCHQSQFRIPKRCALTPSVTPMSKSVAKVSRWGTCVFLDAFAVSASLTFRNAGFIVTECLFPILENFWWLSSTWLIAHWCSKQKKC